MSNIREMSEIEFKEGLAEGAYTSIGSYPKYLIMKDGECLCFECAKKNQEQILVEYKEPTNKEWQALIWNINWESYITCSHCEEKIESAYGEED